jgi:hypothetical protein
MGLLKSSTYFTPLLYEAFQVKPYFTAFFTFFIPVSLFDLESRFFVPTHTCWKATRAGAVRAGRRSALASARCFQAEP